MREDGRGKREEGGGGGFRNYVKKRMRHDGIENIITNFVHRKGLAGGDWG